MEICALELVELVHSRIFFRRSVLSIDDAWLRRQRDDGIAWVARPRRALLLRRRLAYELRHGVHSNWYAVSGRCVQRAVLI